MAFPQETVGLVAPASGANVAAGAAVTFAWQGVSGATSYLLQICSASGCAGGGQVASFATALTSQTYTPAPGSYTFLVTAYQGGSVLAMSETRPFWTDDFCAGAFVLGDFDGNGTTDRLCASEGASRVALSAATGLQAPTVWLSQAFAQPITGDFNGDGKTDLATFDQNNAQISVALSIGTAFAAPVYWGTAAATYSCRLRAVLTPADFNGDGKTDLACKVENPSDQEVYVGLSTGSSFTFSIVGNALCNEYEDGGTVDYNGDGRADWFCMGRGNGIGKVFPYVNGVLGAGITVVDSNFCTPGRVVIGDFTGDGRTDFACPSSGQVMMSTGNAYLYQAVSSTSCVDLAAQAFAADVDGDGVSELVCNSTHADAANITVRKWNGTTFGSEQTWMGSFCAGPVAVGDFNGDGQPDLLCDKQRVAVSGQAGVRPDLMTSAVNSLGGTIQVAYLPSSLYPSSDPGAGGVRQVVSQVTIGDGRGTSATTTYAYGGGKVDRTERQFLGFSAVTEIRPCLSNETACPYTFTTLSQQLASVGAPTAVYRYDGQDRILTKQVNTFTYNGATVPRTALLTQADSYVCGTGDSVCMASDTRHTYETYGYDNYGNIALRVQRGDASVTDDDVQTQTTYTYNTSSYIVNRPASLDVRAPGGPSALSCTTYEYDGGSLVKGDLTAVNRWLDRGSRYVRSTTSYDSYGNAAKTTDATGRGATTLWDPSGLFPTSACYGGNGTSCASGVETSTTSWDAKCAAPSQAIDANAQTVTTTYDALCRPSLTTTPLSGYVQRYYLSTGNPSQQRARVETPAPTGVSGVLWSETYVDGLGRTWQSIQRGPSGQTIVSERSYNARGRVSAAGAPRYSSETTLWTDYEFDPLDRVTRVLLPGSRQVLTSYEATSSTTTDPDQKATTQRTDAYGRVTSVERAGGTAITRSGYDLLGRRTSMHDPVNSEWIWQFDSLGRMWDEQDPDAGHKSYTYDDAGRLLTTTDAKSQTTTLAYHSVTGRLESRTNGAGLVSYTYSEPRPGYLNTGRLTTVTSPSDVLQTDYDALGRSTRLRRTLDGTLYTISQAFDASGALSSTTYPDGDVIGSLSYDDAGRLASIPGIVSSVSYDAVGRPLTQSNVNATNTTWSYEADRQFLSGIQTTSPQGTIQDLQYLQYTDAGLLQHLTSPVAGEGWTYEYDDLNHLTKATNLTSSSDSQDWTYDAADRITYNSRVGTYTYPAPGQPRPHAPDTVNGAAMSYDLNGNLWSGSGRTLVWDANNRITQATAGTVTTTFTYDGGGERLKKTSSQGTSLYPFGDDYEITNGTITKYISVAGLGVVAKRVGAGAGAVTYWLHSDRLGSIQAVTNSAGAAVYRRTYRPYGETLATSGSHTESRGWIDQRNDTESGLTYLHARHYDPMLGTFLSADPLGIAAGPNAFAYGHGNPTNGVDRTGLDIVLCTPQPTCNGGPGGPGPGNTGGVYAPGGPPREPTSVPRPDYTDQTVKGALCFLFGMFCGKPATSDMMGPNNAIPQQGPPVDRGASIPNHPTGPAAPANLESPVIDVFGTPTGGPGPGGNTGNGGSTEPASASPRIYSPQSGVDSPSHEEPWSFREPCSTGFFDRWLDSNAYLLHHTQLKAIEAFHAGEIAFGAATGGTALILASQAARTGYWHPILADLGEVGAWGTAAHAIEVVSPFVAVASVATFAAGALDAYNANQGCR